MPTPEIDFVPDASEKKKEPTRIDFQPDPAPTIDFQADKKAPLGREMELDKVDLEAIQEHSLAEAPGQPTELSPTTEFTETMARAARHGFPEARQAAGEAFATVTKPFQAAGADIVNLARMAQGKKVVKPEESLIPAELIPPPEKKGIGPSIERFLAQNITAGNVGMAPFIPESKLVPAAFATQAGLGAANAAEEYAKATDTQERLGAATDFFLNLGMGALMARSAAAKSVQKASVFEQRMGRKPTPEEAKQILTGNIELSEVEPTAAPTEAVPKETAPPLAAEVRPPVGEKSPPVAPAPTETPKAPQTLAEAIQTYSGPALADSVESLISQGKAPKSLQAAVNRFRIEGRGDAAAAEEAVFKETLQKEAARKRTGPREKQELPQPDAPEVKAVMQRAMQLIAQLKPERKFEAEILKNIAQKNVEKVKSNIRELEIISQGGKVVRTEVGDYGVLDAIKESGGIGGPKLDEALERMAKGEPAAKVTASFGGDYDGLAPILQQIFEARRTKNWTEYNRLKKAYSEAGFGSGEKKVDKTLGAIQGLKQEGFGAFKPKSADELIDAAWKAASKGEAKPVETTEQLSKDEKFALAASERPGAVQKSASDLSVGDTFEVGGKKVTVVKVDPDTGDVTVNAGEFGAQVIREGDSIFVEKYEGFPLDESFGATEPGEQAAAAVQKAAAEKKYAATTEPALQPMGGDLASEGPPQPGGGGAAGEDTLGIKNRKIDEWRVANGLPPTMAPMRRTYGGLWDRIMSRIAADDAWLDNLVSRFEREPTRVPTDEEVLALDYRWIELQYRYGRALDDVRTGQESQPDLLPEYTDAAVRIRDEMERFTDMTRALGSEAGRALAARRVVFKRDYTIAGMEMELRDALGRPLTDAERTELQNTQRQLQETTAAAQAAEAQWRQRVSELEAERNIAQQRQQALPFDQRVLDFAERFVQRLENSASEADRRARERLSRLSMGIDPTIVSDLVIVGSAKIARLGLDLARFTDEMIRDYGERIRPVIQEIWDRANASLNEEIRRQSEPVRNVFRTRGRNLQNIIEQTGDAIQSVVQRGELDRVFPLVQRLVRAIVERSMNISRDALVDEVWDVLKASLPDITRRDAMDAISGYGRFQPLRKDDLSVRLRDLKGQLQQVAKLEDLQSRQPPRKTGLERREPSDVERRLIALVNEAKRRFGVRITDPETQLRSVLDARKTAMRNQISDLDYQIRTRQRIVRERTAPPTDPELERLRVRRDELKQEFNNIFGRRELSMAERAQRESARLEREIAEVERQIREGDIFAKKQQRQQLSSDELEAQRARLAAAKAERDYLRESINPKTRLSPEEKTIRAYEARLKREIADKTERMAKGDFESKAKRPPPELPPSVRKLKADAEKVRQDFQKRLELERAKNRTPLEKAKEKIVKWRQVFAISGIKSIAKLISASVQGTVLLTLREGAGAVLSKLPVLSDVSKKAVRESGSSLAIEAKAHAEAWKMFLSDFGKNIKGDKPDFERIYGGRAPVPPELENWVGNLHTAEKGLLSRNEFTRSYEIRRRQAAAAGMDVNDPIVDMEIGYKAWEDSQFWKFQNRNIVASSFRQVVKRLEQVKGMKGDVTKAGAFTMRMALPVVTVPTNIVARVLEGIYGVPLGGLRLTKQALSYAMKNKTFRGVIDNMAPEDADLIMRNFKTGSVGLGFMLIGYLNPSHFGGYWMQGEKRKKDEPKFGSVKVDDVNIPSFVLHNPFLEAVQFGATIRRIQDSRLKKRDKETQGLVRGILSATLKAVEEQPFVRESTDINKLLSERQRDQYIGDQARSILIPQAMQNVAEWMDKDYKGKNIIEWAESDPVKRKPTNVIQNVELGIPDLRKNVPLAPAKAP